MTRYRIYTEDLKDTERLVRKYFNGFTVFKGIGYWKGSQERNLTIEILTPYQELDKIRLLVNDIKKTNHQEAVLFTSEEVTGCLI